MTASIASRSRAACIRSSSISRRSSLCERSLEASDSSSTRTLASVSARTAWARERAASSCRARGDAARSNGATLAQ
eukprot:5424454-Prymnesium_polylepis.2